MLNKTQDFSSEEGGPYSYQVYQFLIKLIHNLSILAFQNISFTRQIDWIIHIMQFVILERGEKNTDFVHSFLDLQLEDFRDQPSRFHWGLL